MRTQRVVLNKETLGLCIDRLRKITSGLFSIGNYFGDHPRDVLGRSGHDLFSGLSIDCLDLGRAEVTVHQFFFNPDLSFTGLQALIHVSLDGCCLAEYFAHGDVFYISRDRIVVEKRDSKTPGNDDIREFCVFCLTKHPSMMDPGDYALVDEIRQRGKEEMEYWERAYREDVEWDLPEEA